MNTLRAWEILQRMGGWLGREVAEDRLKVGGLHAPAMAAQGMEEQRAAFSVGDAGRSPQQQVAQVLDLQEAREAAEAMRAVQKDVENMTPEQRVMAEKFMEPPKHERSRGRERGF